MEKILCIVLLFAATIIDIRSMRIPNFLTVTFALIGLVIGIMQHSFLIHFWGLCLGLVLFLMPYAKGVLGAGDVKLMAAIGSIMGFPFILYNSLIVLIAGGVISALFIIYQNNIRYLFGFVFNFVTSISFMHLKSSFHIVNDSKKTAYPYSLSITCGTLVTMWLSTFLIEL
jgi:prepilin peptidase CpaA